MLLPSAVIAKTGAAAFSGNGLNFYNGGSGNNYVIKSSLAGVSDNAFGSISIWLKISAGDGVDIVIMNPTSIAPPNNIAIFRNGANNSLLFNIENTIATAGFTQQTVASAITGMGWHHILADWDTNHAAGAKIMNVYVDDVSIAIDGSSSSDVNAAFTVGYAGCPFNFCSSTGNQQISLSEIWFAPGQFIDFTSSANRAKFSTLGRPISLGADGSTPTGVAPAVYLHNAAATAGTNSGTGGNFTIQGTITDTSPP